MTIKLSNCCRADVREDEEDVNIFVCEKCDEVCEADDVCEECLGTGEVRVMEPVYPGEPHMADTGTRKCLCQFDLE